jgi:hypothetical protein
VPSSTPDAPSIIANASRRRNRHPAGREIDDRRHDVDRGARCAVAAGLGSLRDQNVGPRIQRLLRHRLVLNLANQQRT